MNRTPRSAVPIVVGLLALAGAAPLVVTRVSTVKRRDFPFGTGRITLEVPKGWPDREFEEIGAMSSVRRLGGPLPAGDGILILEAGLPEAEGPAGAADRETWTDGPLRFSLSRFTGSEWTGFVVHATDGALFFSASFACSSEDFEANRPLLERCARSLRWIGGPAP